MAIRHQAAVEDGILVVRAEGCDDDLEGVQAYGAAVIAACCRAGVARVLCDERGLEYRLNVLDTYQVAASLAGCVPHLARAAIVPNPRGWPDAKFWEDVAVNRGLKVRVFADPAQARAWLQEA